MRVQPLALLFAAISVGLGVIAVTALLAGAFPVGIAAAVIAVWMATLVPRAARRR
jgi:hypothetical protein